MYQIEIHNRIDEIVQIFYQFGVWRKKDESNVTRKMVCKLSYLLVFTCFFVSLITGGLLSDDKNVFIFLIAVGVSNAVITVKLAYILWKKEQINAFISDIGVHSIEDNEEFIKVNKKVKNLMKFSSAFMLMIFALGGALIFFYLPIFTSEKMLPLNTWFPFDWKNNEIIYWIGYAFASMGTMISAIAISFNVIIWYLMMNCAIKYQILGNQFRNIAKTNPKIEKAKIEKAKIRKRKITEEEKQKLFLEQLIGLIKTHRNIQETIDRFKSCFANLFFAQITTSGICICGSVYALAFGNHHKDLFQLGINVVVLCYNLFDIFMVMYFGNEIKLWSDRLSYSLFESNWIEQSKSCKKCIIILTEVLKQPHELVIGKLYPLTLETFTAILNLAYSMFNILKNLT